MSETELVSTAAPRKRGLSGMVLAELRQLAGELNITDITGMRKGDLIAAIKERQSGGSSAPQLSLPDTTSAPTAPAAGSENGAAAAAPPRRRRAASRPAGAPDPKPAADGAAAPAEAPGTERTASGSRGPRPPPPRRPPRRRAEHRAEHRGAAARRARAAAVGSASAAGPSTAARRHAAEPAAPAADAVTSADAPADGRGHGKPAGPAVAATGPTTAAPTTGATGADNRGARQPERPRRQPRRRQPGHRQPRPADNRADSRSDNRADSRSDDRADNRPDSRSDNRPDTRGPRDNRPDDDGDDDGDGRGRRGRRFRDRRRGRDRQPTGQGRGGQGAVDTEVREGDVLLPVAGIVDILDNYAFVRTTGYLSGPTDVYVSLSMVRKYGLRRGDAITGAVREQREGEQSRQKFNPLVRVDAINGQDPETSRKRPEFTKLTPLYPNERLRLETEPHKLTTRVIDLVMPIGKGQRALIVSPPKAGKTTIMQNIANAVTTNNPECHLMVVLVDERPEEVTDMQRSVKGEVIASTFDRPPTDHTTIAELSIERAKRLVEMGHDVVVLLDNITRLGRAYNLAAPASGRILSGGVDSTALYPPKRFLGAARNIEDGGSLTILATALVETGSTMDTVIFEEFKGTGNAELKLDRRIADKRVFPAIDVGDSSTRKDELLMSPDEYAVMVKLRRLLPALDDQQAIDLLLTQLRKTRTNIEFLMQVAKSTPGADLD